MIFRPEEPIPYRDKDSSGELTSEPSDKITF